MYPTQPIQPMYWPQYSPAPHIINFISMRQNINNAPAARGVAQESMPMGARPMLYPLAHVSPPVPHSTHTTYYDGAQQQYNISTAETTQPGGNRSYPTVVASIASSQQQEKETKGENLMSETADVLAAATPKQRINWLGNKLHPIVSSISSEHAGKVRGMIL